MKSKGWFVIIHQDEIGLLNNQSELAVFAAVKSFTANGKQRCMESYLSISKRAKVSDVWTKQIITKLINRKVLTYFGLITKRGGSCPILEVLTSLELNNTQSSNTLRALSKSSSKSVSLSSKSLVSKFQQSNKVIKEIWSYYIAMFGTKERLLPAREAKITARLQQYSPEEIKRAISNCASDKFWKTQNCDFIFRSDTNLDRLLNLKSDSRQQPKGVFEQLIERREAAL